MTSPQNLVKQTNCAEANLVTPTRFNQPVPYYKCWRGLNWTGVSRPRFNGYSDWRELLIRPPMSMVLVRRARSSPPAALLALAILLTLWCRPSPAWPAERIVSLAPSITETLFAIGAGPEVVGVSQYCDYPPAALKLPRVGSFLTPNLEAIVGLRPGLIIGLDTSSNDREIRALERMGYQVLTINDDSLGGIRESIRKI